MTDSDESRATTHAADCWSWGPAHYKCAVREIERLRAEVERLRADRDSWEQQASDRVADWHAEHLRAERLAEALKEIRSRLADLPTHPEDPWEFIAICRIADAVLAQEG